MLTRYSLEPSGPIGSFRPSAYIHNACRVLPLLASNMPTDCTNFPSAGSDCIAVGAASRDSCRGSTVTGRTTFIDLSNSCRLAPNFGGLYGSYNVIAGTIKPSQPSRSHTTAACSSDCTWEIFRLAYTSTTRLTGITVSPCTCCNCPNRMSACKSGSTFSPLRSTAGATAQVWRRRPGMPVCSSVPYWGSVVLHPVASDPAIRSVNITNVRILRVMLILDYSAACG